MRNLFSSVLDVFRGHHVHGIFHLILRKIETEKDNYLNSTTKLYTFIVITLFIYFHLKQQCHRHIVYIYCPNNIHLQKINQIRHYTQII